MRDLDRCCISIGHACTHCGIAMPEEDDSPRLCPAINDDVSREEVKQESPYNYETGEYDGDESPFQCARDDCEETVSRVTSKYCSTKCRDAAFREAANELEEFMNE